MLSKDLYFAIIIKANTEDATAWSWSFLYCLTIGFLFCLLGFSQTLDIVVLFVSLLLMLLGFSSRLFAPLYFAFVLFEPVLSIPFFQASYFRVYQVLFVVYLALIERHNVRRWFHRIKQREQPLFFLVIAMLVFLALSPLYVTGIVKGASLLINFVILGYMSLKIAEKEWNYEVILGYITVFAAMSAIYGFLHGREMVVSYGSRHFGTYADPNYSAYFYAIGLIACFAKNKLTTTIKTIIALVLAYALYRTNSMTGYIFITITAFIYCFNVRKHYALLMALVALMGIAFLYLTPMQEGTFFHSLQYRIKSFQGGNLDGITSNRSALIREYLKGFFNELPLLRILFGGMNILEEPLLSEMLLKYGLVSHNILVDMLYTVGLFGVMILSGIFTLLLYLNLRRFNSSKSINDMAAFLMKCCVLTFSLSLSIYPYRNFYTFLFLL